MSGAGFRTLAVASRRVPAGEFAAWEGEYKAAASSLEGREEKVGLC
jgi:hypothetical protein